ncbi:MAG: 2,3-cyclic 3-phosphodiesterase [Solirubrobacteraceae bacterium]|nr:2,3-cyclic 3-phosphodiesterase [Solirubrobacteraceae bacterium]
MAETGRARLFVALDLPANAREALVEWQRRALAGRDDLRAVAPEALHVTLAFLGSRPVEEVEQIATAVGGAVGGLPAASLAALAARPVPRRRARLFALDLSDGGGRAGAVHAAVSAALGERGFYSPERRAFWPHVTVARVGRAERSVAPLSLPPPGEPFMADEVVLYRSHLGGGPARYEALERWRLRRV